MLFISHHYIIWKASLQLFASCSKRIHGNLSRLRDTSSLLGLAKLVSALGEDLVEVVLEPPDIRVEAGELPYAVDLLVPVGVVAVGVTLDGDVRAGLVAVLLMRHTELVVADDLVVRDLLPLRAADEVLGHEGGVAEDLGVRGHLDELVCGHGLPDFVEERAVVDAEGRGNALGQACPVLGVVGAGPLVDGGHAALHLWEAN
jgi:hypothetical protein